MRRLQEWECVVPAMEKDFGTDFFEHKENKSDSDLVVAVVDTLTDNYWEGCTDSKLCKIAVCKGLVPCNSFWGFHKQTLLEYQRHVFAELGIRLRSVFLSLQGLFL